LFSSSSPCSSGYATPQQTALTDSMVDTLAWKNLNIKGGVRNPMEDSTDTLVDDGHKVWQRKSSINMVSFIYYKFFFSPSSYSSLIHLLAHNRS
jgi:hypothetical protein